MSEIYLNTCMINITNMEWKKITGFENYYEVSNTGIVRSIDRSIKYIRLNNNINCKRKSLILKPKLTWDGYYEISLSKNKKRYYKRAHSLVIESFIGKKIGFVCNHKDGNKLNNNINNLEWVTIKENMLHAIKNNLIHFAKGEQISKLKNNNIIDIRKRVANGETQVKLAKEYNVGKNCIYHIIKRNTWRHIK